MTKPPTWLFLAITILGLCGLISLVWGLLRNNRAAVWLGHFGVCSHMLTYSFAPGATWLIGLGALSFALAGVAYPSRPGCKYRPIVYASLAIPPGLLYVGAMGLWGIFLLGGGM